MKKTILFALILMTAACAPSYEEKLTLKLENKSPQEKRMILTDECKKQTGDMAASGNSRQAEHVQKMREICGAWTGKGKF